MLAKSSVLLKQLLAALAEFFAEAMLDTILDGIGSFFD